MAFDLPGCQAARARSTLQRGTAESDGRWGLAFERQFGALHGPRCSNPETDRAGNTKATVSLPPQW